MITYFKDAYLDPYYIVYRGSGFEVCEGKVRQKQDGTTEPWEDVKGYCSTLEFAITLIARLLIEKKKKKPKDVVLLKEYVKLIKETKREINNCFKHIG